jgi:hypothetical protein
MKILPKKILRHHPMVAKPVCEVNRDGLADRESMRLEGYKAG